jgi:hypothetical protein
VNLMTYVSHVFQKVFGWTRQKAEHHMLEVHRQGKSMLVRTTMEKGGALRASTPEVHPARHDGARVVNLKRAPKGGLVIQLNARRKKSCLMTLKLYPLVPATHHRSDQGRRSGSDENQHLLEESLAEQRTENRRQLEALLNAPDRGKKGGKQLSPAT